MEHDHNAPDAEAETFLFVVIRASLGPISRADAFEDELDRALQSRGLGSITGGGSQLGDERPDGTRQIHWCGLDVQLAQSSAREAALRLLRTELLQLDAPAGSELHYTESGRRLLDRLDEDGWVVRQSREETHPAFGY